MHGRTHGRGPEASIPFNRLLGVSAGKRGRRSRGTRKTGPKTIFITITICFESHRYHCHRNRPIENRSKNQKYARTAQDTRRYIVKLHLNYPIRNAKSRCTRLKLVISECRLQLLCKNTGNIYISSSTAINIKFWRIRTVNLQGRTGCH